MGQAMIPNDERPCLEQQKFIILAINTFGFEPFHKPIHLYTKDELRNITMMYREVVASYGVDRITPKFIKASENVKDRRSLGGRPS